MSQATFADGATRDRVQGAVDTILRPSLLAAAKALNSLAVFRIAMLASPSGAVSSVATPASDSIAGIVAALPAASVIPASSSLAGAQPLTREQVLGVLIDADSILAAHWTDGSKQLYALAVGPGNLIGA